MAYSPFGAYFTMITRLCLIVVTFYACTAPKKVQPGKPFVFKNTITVEGNIHSDKKKALETRLLGQLDDSIRVRVKSYAGLYKELLNPPVFDSMNVGRSKQYMNALLYTEGYFRSYIQDSIVQKVYPGNLKERLTFTFAYLFSPKRTKQPQIRTHTYFKAHTGPALLIDTVIYAITDSNLQKIALTHARRSSLRKGEAFRQNDISSELDRVSDVFKNNGYFKFSADDLYAEADTIDLSLITIDNDPFDQLRLLAEAQKRQERPTVKITIKQRPVADSGVLQRHYIGNVRIFPDLKVSDNTNIDSFSKKSVDGLDIYYHDEKFKSSFLRRHSRLLKDSLFRQFNYVRTVNAYNQLEAWRQVNVEAIGIRYDSVPYIDFDIRLMSTPKQSLIFELESSRNTGSDAFSSGNLLGVGVNIGIRNKNVAREAIQSVTQLRAGIELNPARDANFILTRQVSFSHNYSIPKLLIPFVSNDNNFRSARTIINATAGYTERKDIFNLGTINTSLGYEWNRRSSSNFSKVFLFRPFNIELNKLTRKPGLDSLFKENPILRYNFSDGLIIGSGFSYITTRRRGNKVNFLKASVEESGGLTGALFKGLYNDLYRFIKLDGEYKFFIEQPKTTWAFRALAGYGYAYGKNPEKKHTLPFFRQYFAGGPNSMRAWSVRSLGPGSVGVDDSTFNKNTPANLRLGDLQFEGNIEFRYNLAVIWDIKIKSALFADIGNIWYRPNIVKVPGVSIDYPIEFNVRRFYRDLAVAGGTSLRLDFDYFLIRLDWSYKLKDPFYANKNDGWFQNLNLGNGQLQLGIGYPF